MAVLNSFQHRLNYHFDTLELLEEAFLAAGASVSDKGVEGPNKGNKRLALVGDAALRLAILDEWYGVSSDTANGEQRVRDFGTNEKLESLAHKWSIEQCITENPSQRGQYPRELLAAIVEAIIGAIWIDSKENIEVVREIVKRLNA